MLIDTHAHINFKAYEDDAEEVLRRAFESGVMVINVGTQLDTSEQSVRLAERYSKKNIPPHSSLNLREEAAQLPPLKVRGGQGGDIKAVYSVVGLHPVHTYSQHVDEEESHFKTREEKFDYEAYKKLAQNDLVVGIGECGLDYFRLKIDDLRLPIEQIKENQKQAFMQQVRLAKELNKALVIHCRPSEGTSDAYEDILAILDSELQISNIKLQNSTNSATPSTLNPNPFRFEIHSFTGTPDIVQEFLKRGAYVGLNGIITFGDRKSKNIATSASGGDKSGNMDNVLKTVPLDRIVLETDSPYLTPKPNRGKRNEPSYVRFVAEHIAQVKNIDFAQVEEQTTKNAINLFKL